MKVSTLLLAGCAGAILVYAVRKIVRSKDFSDVVHDIFFDAEFLPETGKINQSIPDNPEMRHWFRTRQGSLVDEDGMFI